MAREPKQMKAGYLTATNRRMHVCRYRFVLDYVNVPTMRIVKRLCASMFRLYTSDALRHLHLKNLYPLLALHSLAFLKLPVQLS